MAAYGIDRTGAAGGTGTSSLIGALSELVDPNANSLLYWDDTAGGFTWMPISAVSFGTVTTTGTITGGAGLAVSNGITVGTTIELGHASDTTLARVAAGRVSVEGVGVVRGPASATANGLARYSGTSGDLVKDSVLVVDDTGHITSFGGNIKFPAAQVASADANTLDDYEEGTWTPGVSFGGSVTGITYTSQDGTYVKIGKQVTVAGALVLLTKGSATGSARLTGLPFTSAIGQTFPTQLSDHNALPSSSSVPRVAVEAAQPTGLLLAYTNAGQAQITEAAFTDTTRVGPASGSYFI